MIKLAVVLHSVLYNGCDKLNFSQFSKKGTNRFKQRIVPNLSNPEINLLDNTGFNLTRLNTMGITTEVTNNVIRVYGTYNYDYTTSAHQAKNNLLLDLSPGTYRLSGVPYIDPTVYGISTIYLLVRIYDANGNSKSIQPVNSATPEITFEVLESDTFNGLYLFFSFNFLSTYPEVDYTFCPTLVKIS